jgi:hypothetical protein
MKKTYGEIQGNGIETLMNWAKNVSQTRHEDIKDFDKLPELYMRGRKTEKVPSSSTDTADCHVGDFNYSIDYYYICVNDSGTLKWRRIPLADIEGTTPLQMPVIAFADLPVSPSDGQLVLVSDDAYGAIPAYSEGGSWLRIFNNTEVSTFDPMALNGLVSFLDAQNIDNFVFTSGSGDGDPVGEWRDSSGKGNYFYRSSTSTANFIYTASGQHSKPCLWKDGKQATMDCIGTTLYTTAATQVVFFSVPAAATQLTGMISGLFKSTAYMGISGVRVPAYVRNQAGTNVNLTAWSSLTDLLMLSIRVANSSTAYFNNNITSSGSFDPDAYTSNGGFRIGSLTPTTDAPEAEYYGVLNYDRSLSDTELSNIFSWGTTRYG